MKTKTKKPNTKKLESPNGKKTVFEEKEEKVRSLKNGDMRVTAKDRKMYELLMEALAE